MFKRLFILVFNLVFLGYSYARDNVDYSSFLKDGSPFSEELLSMDSISDSDKKQAIEIAHILLPKLVREGENLKACYLSQRLIEMYNQVGDYSIGDSIFPLGKSLCEVENALFFEGILNSNMGVYKGQTGDLSGAISCFVTAINIFKKLDESEHQIRNAVYLAVAYIQDQDFDEALRFLNDAEEMISMENSENFAFKAEMEYLIESRKLFCYSMMGDFAKAKVASEKAKVLMNDKNSTTYFGSIIIYFLKKGKLDSALYYLNKNDEALSKSGNYWAQMNNMLRQVGILYDLQKHQEAIEILNNLIEIATNNEAKLQLSSAYYELAYNYMAVGNFESASNAFAEHIELQHELDNAEKTQMAKRLIAEYELKNKDELIALLRQNEAANKTIISNQKIKNISLIVGLILLLVIVIIVNISKDKLSEKNEALKIKSKELEELNEINRRVFSIISHDMRSPLADISGMMMLVKDNSLTVEELDHFLTELEKKNTEIQQLLDNLLNWGSSLTQGKTVSFEKINLLEKVVDILALYSAKIKSKELSVIVDVPADLEVLVDGESLKFVLRNLISNAFKFSNQGKKVWISAKNGNAIELTIKDEGIGMSKEIVDALFKVSEKKRRKGTDNEVGAGLGMSLVDGILKANNIQIEVLSSINKGSAFKLRFLNGNNPV